MDNLAALAEVKEPAVLDLLLKRLSHRQYHTYFGDFLLLVNPCHGRKENESEQGQWYRTSKPLQKLPPHVLAIAHRAYRMLLNDVMPQVIVITGRSGSGKTEAARRVVSQLLEEARLSPDSGLGQQINTAQRILTTMITARTFFNPETTRGIKMATLYFRPDGQMVFADLRVLCLDKWFLVDRGTGADTFSIFYALLAGLPPEDIQLYSLVHKYRLLSRGENFPLFRGPEEQRRYRELFDIFMTSLLKIGIDQQTRNTAGEKMSAILALLAAILHLSNLDVTAHVQSGHSVIDKVYELRAACDLLAVSQDQLEAELLFTTITVRGEVVRIANTVQQALWNRDVIMVELYRRLLTVIISRLNLALSPGNQNNHAGQGPQTAITVVESPAQDIEGTTGGLDTFLRNMAAERIQYHLYDVIFRRDVESCNREGVQAIKIKYADNTKLISAVFGPDYGIMNKVTGVSLDPQGSPAQLVSLMDNDHSLKKTGCYVNAGKARKSLEAFTIQHAGLGKVKYSARDFLSKNRSALPESARQMLLLSRNPLVSALGAIVSHNAGYPPDMTSPTLSFTTTTFQSDLAYLLQTLDNCNLHYIRCVRPNSTGTPGQFDSSEVQDQLKECCVVETTQQRKSGYSACWTQEHFVRSYRELAYGPFSTVPSLSKACQTILQKTDLLGKGVTLSKTSLFLSYWQVQCLHALKAERLRRITLVQALVRGFLARRRVGRRRTTSEQQRALIGEFMNDMTFAGNRAAKNVQAQADFHRSRLKRQDMSRRLHSSIYENLDDYQQNYSPVYENVDRPLTRQDSGPYSPGDWSDSTFSRAPDDPTVFYTHVVSKVLSSLPKLGADTWVKIIYMERGKKVAKVKVADRSVTVDGSGAEYNGRRFGLGKYLNPDRDRETTYYRDSIKEGVKLEPDADGNILACRLCDDPIIVMGHENPDGDNCFSADVMSYRGQLPFEKTIKIFDFKEFRSKIALDLKQGCFSKARMQRACVLGLCFGRDDMYDLETPCWLCLVSVKALIALESDEIGREAQVYTAKQAITSPEERIRERAAEDAKTRHARNRWARTDQRDHLQENEGGERRIRQQLRAKGLPIGEHLEYSWQKTKVKDDQTAPVPRRIKSLGQPPIASPPSLQRPTPQPPTDRPWSTGIRSDVRN